MPLLPSVNVTPPPRKFQRKESVTYGKSSNQPSSPYGMDSRDRYPTIGAPAPPSAEVAFSAGEAGASRHFSLRSASIQ